ncbi:XRE family transcriptional regulator [Variovorax paradoxus]|nr:helix-turn-helix transcriptional regulator [Variovorax paradoxus]MBT2303426.1 XRE family transcriptional regulator [Variovorax paradoxus]
MPFTKVTRKASARQPSPLPVTIGDHIRMQRSERKLLQQDVANQIGVSPATVANWEKNRTPPPVSLIPAIVRFIGFDPSPEPATLAEQMRAYRQRHGLSIKAAARRAGVHEDSWGQWERTGLIPWKRYRVLLDEFLAQESRKMTGHPP